MGETCPCNFHHSGWLRASALTFPLIFLVGVKWSCLRIDKQVVPPEGGADQEKAWLVHLKEMVHLKELVHLKVFPPEGGAGRAPFALHPGQRRGQEALFWHGEALFCHEALFCQKSLSCPKALFWQKALFWHGAFPILFLNFHAKVFEGVAKSRFLLKAVVFKSQKRVRTRF